MGKTACSSRQVLKTQELKTKKTRAKKTRQPLKNISNVRESRQDAKTRKDMEVDDLTLTTDECNGNDSNQPFAVDASNCVSTTTTKISIAPTCTLDKEIFETMKAKEKMSHSLASPIFRQKFVNITMRSILIDWMVEVVEEYKLVSKTLFLAVNYVDRFLSAVSIERCKLQLLGVAALSLAAKFEEVQPPRIADYAFISGNTYDPSQIVTMERDLFTILNFELAATPPSTFLDHICFACHVDENAFYLSYYLTELFLLDYSIWQFLPSQIACSAICLANHALGLTPWPLTHETFANYKLGQLSECMARLLCCWKSACSPEQTLRALTEKYSSDMKNRVTLIIKPPQDIPRQYHGTLKEAT